MSCSYAVGVSLESLEIRADRYACVTVHDNVEYKNRLLVAAICTDQHGNDVGNSPLWCSLADAN